LDDALAAISLARTTPGVNKKQLYLMGHSLGGMLAPRIASLAPDLNGIILLAAPARKLTDLIVEQNNYMYALTKDTTAAGKQIMAEAQVEFSKSKLTTLGTTIKADSVVLGLPASYWVDLNNYDQVEAAKKLKQRVFIAQGGNDFQVSMADFDLWKAALGKRKNVTLKPYLDLNHLLTTQTEKGSAEQYRKPGNVSSLLIDDITAWINTN
jgi:dienelactone hydrolase